MVGSATEGMPFDMKLKGSDLFKTNMQVENLNKSIIKDGREIKQELGKDDFLKLLITQLQNQDPQNPMEDREFIAQMAQFTSMEQMLNMNKSMDKLVDGFSFKSSFDLLGKNVEVKGSREGEAVNTSGIVESISKNGSDIQVSVNGSMYSVDDVVRVDI